MGTGLKSWEGKRPAQWSPAEFLEAHLHEVNGHFYAQGLRSEKEWWQDQVMLKKAILQVNEDMRARGRSMSLEKQTAVLRSVWRTILEHGGWRTVHNMARYLWKCVQEHMVHRGPRYYEDAKAAEAKSMGRLTGPALAELRAMMERSEGNARVLQEVCSVLSAGKRKKGATLGKSGAGGAAIQGEMFGGDLPELLAVRSKTAETSRIEAGDSERA